MTKRELLSDRTNALLVLMHMDEMFNKFLLPKLPQEASNGDGNGNSNLLLEVFGDQYQKIRQEILEQYEICGDIDAVIDEILSAHPVPAGKRKKVIDALKLFVLRAKAITEDSPMRPLLNVEFLRTQGGFDKIMERFGTKRSIFFGKAEATDFEELRSILRSFMSFEDAKARIAEMRRKGQPLNSQREYLEWVRSGYDYKAVLKYRKGQANG
jgi:hypothetical protein